MQEPRIELLQQIPRVESLGGINLQCRQAHLLGTSRKRHFICAHLRNLRFTLSESHSSAPLWSLNGVEGRLSGFFP